MLKKVLIFTTIVTFLIVLNCCSNQTTIDAKDTEIQELEGQIQDYELLIKDIKGQRDSYKKFIDSSIQYLSKEGLLELAKNEWIYSVEVNGQSVQPNGIVEMDAGDLKIVLVEQTTVLSSVTTEIFNAGKISGNYYDHLEIIGIQPSNTYITDGTTVQGMVYEFIDMQKGTIVKLKLTEELKERLDLETNTIIIKIK